MIIMSKTSPCIAWNLVMESLAEVKDIDTTVLENLMKVIPHGYELLDSNTKERIALRRLFDETDNVDTTVTNSSSVIDVSESAQDVYNRIRNKMETSNLPDSLKLDIRHFAIQKKNHLPKCQLQQLEEALSQRGQSPNVSLREVLCVGLAKNEGKLNNGLEIKTADVNHTHSLSGNLENHLQEDFHAEPSSITKKDGIVQVLDNSAAVPSSQDVANISEQCKISGKLQQMNEMSQASAPNILNDTVQVDHANDVLVSGKRKRCEFEKDQLLHSMDTEKQNELEQSSDQVLVTIPLESSYGKNISSVQIKTRGAQVQAIDDCERVSRRLGTAAKCPQTEVQEVTMEDANGNMQSPNTVKLPDKNQASILYSQEEVAAMKSSLIDSQMTSAQDSVEVEWREDNLCIKCNKRYKLLDCCVDTCPIKVHERCLGSSAEFDAMGRFYCPLCSYAQAHAAYHDAKEKASRAKKKAVLLRNHLKEFMNLKGNQKKQSEVEAPKDKGNDHVDAEAVVNPEPLLDAEALVNQEPISEPPPVNAPRGGEAVENRKSLDHPLVNPAQETDVNASVHCDSVNDGQGPVNVAKESMSRLNVIAPSSSPLRVPSRPFDEIVDSHSAATKMMTTDSVVVDGSGSRKSVLIDQEAAAADVGAATGPSSSRPSTSSDQISEDVSVQDNGNTGFIFRKRNTLTPSRQIKKVTTRRVKTKWTDAEVAMLEEGRKKFGTSDWKNILEFGKNVFNECRVPGDLKDKWRNMQK